MFIFVLVLKQGHTDIKLSLWPRLASTQNSSASASQELGVQAYITLTGSKSVF